MFRRGSRRGKKSRPRRRDASPPRCGSDAGTAQKLGETGAPVYTILTNADLEGLAAIVRPLRPRRWS